MQVHQSKSQQIIKKIMSKEHHLSEERVKTILTAGIIRCLKGRTTVSFVTELAAEISEEHEMLLTGDLLEIISFLNLLDYETKYTKISHQLIHERLHNVLNKLTSSQSLQTN